jgi:outer membrane protein
MKNGLLFSNVILAIAVAVLFYLQFSSKNSTSSNGKATSAANNGPFKIAYFEMDSLENNYEYFKEVRAQLRTKDQSVSAELNQIKTTYYNTYKEYNEKAASMTQTEQASWQQKLDQLQKNYQDKEQMLSQEMQDESFKKLQDVKKKIEAYLKEYNKDKTYAYILINQSDIIYYRDSIYNITNDVLNGLNAQYKKK